MYLGSWRPISLLNVTYKLTSTANHIKDLLSNFRKSVWFSWKNITLEMQFTQGLQYDIMCSAQYNLTEEDEPVVLLGIDFWKAFDCIFLLFMRKVLFLVNSGPSVLRLFDTLYDHVYLSVFLNGFLSTNVPSERGYRKRDPHTYCIDTAVYLWLNNNWSNMPIIQLYLNPSRVSFTQ